MNNVSRFKVIVSFLALLAVLFFSLYFVHRELGVLTQSEGSNVQWMDSLSVLLKEKDDNTIRILRTLAEANDSLISTAEIEDIITSQDTIVLRPRIQRHVVHHRDTVVSPSSPPKKKGFFKRLRDAFSTPKPDSVIIQVKTSVEYTVDTLIDVYNPIDSLQARLREVVRREREVNDGIRRRKNRLQAVNTQLTARIDTLLKHYEEKTLQRAREDAERRQELRLHSARTIGTIAVGAVLLAAFFLVLIGRDIARNNRYRRELEEARSRAEDLLAARERMMLAITHDFKAPLGSIIGYADLLSRLTVDGRQRFYLDNMKQSSQHLLRLVTDLLDFHRLDLHKAEVHQVPFHPARLLEEVCISFQPLTADKGLELQRQVAPELSAAYVCDPLRLRQIINNLLSNAVKFTEKGSISLKARYEQRLLVVAVTDTGKGIKPDDRERIFQEYNKLLLSMRPSIGLTFLKEIKALWPCLDILSSTMQRLDFHPEGDVWKHTLLVTDLAALCRHKTSNPLGFMWSALLHDIGKPEVTTPEGRAPRHNESGVKIFDSQVTCYIPDKKLQRYIRTMIYYHMHLMNMVRNGARDYGYFKILKGINGIVPVDDLILITKCDKLGRYKDEHENINRFDYVMKEKMARLGKEAKEPVINGNDLKGLGIEPSSKYKEILEWAYDQQLKGHDRVAILKMLKGR